MKIGAIPETIFERLALWMGIAPTPLVDTHVAFMMARTIITAVKLGIFECLSNGALTTEGIAGKININVTATDKLLKTLVHLGYLKMNGNHFLLSALSKKYMLMDSPRSLYYKMLFHFVEWDIVQHYDNYLKTGIPLDIHGSFFKEQEWILYQNAMRDLANLASEEISRVTPIPKNALRMLDVGGAHGKLSCALCQRHPNLQSIILDLPEAMGSSEEKMAREDTGGRLSYIAGDIRIYDLGEEEWDVIFMANLVHHFDAETNRSIAKKIAKGLRPGVIVLYSILCTTILRSKEIILAPCWIYIFRQQVAVVLSL
jgi:2-polyprenyl-3-methyl-5-hydroxy-6-metoxy-1,4-benzoquinol methylase